MQQLRRVIRLAMLNKWITKDPFANYQCKIVEPKQVFFTKEELPRLEQWHRSPFSNNWSSYQGFHDIFNSLPYQTQLKG